MDGPESTPPQRFEQSVLRNAVITSAAASMAQRHVTLESCFGKVPIVDTLKLRFAVDVSAKPRGGITKAWRFDELVEGQELPPAFGACAAEAFGRDHALVPPDGSDFPFFDGEISLVYTLTRQPMTAAEADAAGQ